MGIKSKIKHRLFREHERRMTEFEAALDRKEQEILAEVNTALTPVNDRLDNLENIFNQYIRPNFSAWTSFQTMLKTLPLKCRRR